tara:strand:- start:19988 stop:21112 length:1125 start_codon:yes stop_codon:yes gene_type:complete
MHVFIDASNIVDGGGLTHLREIINCTKKLPNRVGKVYICGFSCLLNDLDNKDWLFHILIPERFNSRLGRLIFRFFKLRSILKNFSPDVLFSPGGILPKFKGRTITMCRNMLPFESEHWMKAGVRGFRYPILRAAQIRSFNSADRVIFLSEYAYETVKPLIKNKTSKLTVIPHGITKYFNAVGPDRINDKQKNKELKLIYVSPITFYKNHFKLIKALIMLEEDGFHLSLDLVGDHMDKEKFKLEKLISKHNHVDTNLVNFHGKITQKEIALLISKADYFIFASSCENFPNTLLEGMASGRLIFCSDLRPMKDILLDGGIYFDPTSIESIYLSIKNVLNSDNNYNHLVEKSKMLSRQYSWEKCSRKTWKFITKEFS